MKKYTSDIAPEEIINDDDDRIHYNGEGWWLSQGRSFSIFSADSMATGEDGDDCSLTFSGTGIAYYSEKADNQGDVDVYIDDVLMETCSTWAEETEQSSICYLNTTLENAQHTIRIVKRSGSFMLLDAFKVYNPGPFIVTDAITDGAGNIRITFNQAVDSTQVLNINNYSLDNGGVITSADIEPQLYTVTLQAAGLTGGESYNLIIKQLSNQTGTAVMTNYGVSFTDNESLVMAFSFDDLDQGVITDSVTGNSTSVISGNITAVTGKSGEACLINTGGYISLSETGVLQNEGFTIEAWINPQGPTQNAGAIISQETAGSNQSRCLFYVQNNQLGFYYSNDDNTSSASAMTKSYIPQNAWTHVALIKDTNFFKLAVNGNIATTDSVTVTQNNSMPIYVGGRANGTGIDIPFSGMIDELKFYASAVSDSYLMEHYRLLADDDFSLVSDNGTLTVTFKSAQQTPPLLSDFQVWVKNNSEMKYGLAIADYQWSDALQQACLRFPALPAAAVAQQIVLTVRYHNVCVTTSFMIAEESCAAPAVSSLSLKGTLKTREVLTAVWTMDDSAGLAESGSAYTWWCGDTADAGFVQIEGVFTQSLMLLPEHAGKFIRVVVTPRNARFASGEPVQYTTTETVQAQDGNPRTDWFMNARYGISNHFLPNYQNLSPAIPDDEKWQPGETWDDFLSTFDVDAYASAVENLGAGFVILTIDQHSGYNLAPSSVYDTILGIAPGVRSPSRRDLVAEISQALGQRKIKLICYFMGYPPATASLTYYDDDAAPHSPDRWGDMLVTRILETEPFSPIITREATRMHAAVVRDFGLRYQNAIAGFWFDGMYNSDWFEDLSEQYNINTLIDGARAGNTDRIITAGGLGNTVYMDFSHGESHGDRDENNNLYMHDYPTSRWDGDDGYHQWFRWIPLGDSAINVGWGVPTNSADGHHYDTDELVSWVKQSTDLNGVIAMDIRVNRFGELDAFGCQQIGAVRDAVRFPTEGIYQDDAPQIAYTGSGWWRSGRGDYSSDGYSYVTKSAGDYFEFTFCADAVSYWSETNSDQGSVDIYIDNVLQTTFSTAAPEHLSSSMLYCSPALTPRQTHVLKGVSKGGGWFLLDFMKVYNKTDFIVTPTLAVQQAISGVVILLFNQSLDADDAQNPDRYTFSNGVVALTAVLSDDKQQVTLSLSVPAGTRNSTLTLGDINNEPHLVSAAGMTVPLTFTAQPPDQLFNDDDLSIEYQADAWTHSTGRNSWSIFNSDSHVSTADGAWAQLNFVGTGVAYFAETNSDQGNVKVFIDDEYYEISAYSDQHDPSHILFSIDGLSFNAHTIRIEKDTGKWILLDAFKVYNAGDIEMTSCVNGPGRTFVLTFNQALDRLTAENINNYTMNNGGVIDAVNLNAPGDIVTLTVSNALSDVVYTLDIIGLQNEILNKTFSLQTEVALLTDDELLDLVQRTTFKMYWDYADPISGMAYKNVSRDSDSTSGTVTTGSNGFGIMSMIVAAERGFISKDDALSRICTIVDFLSTRATRYKGAWAHWMNGDTGETIPFDEEQTGGDIVETSYMMMGLFCARQYFNDPSLTDSINTLWEGIEWDYFSDNSDTLYWNIDAEFNVLSTAVTGWNEAMIAYILAISSPTHPISPDLWVSGWSQGSYKNKNQVYYGITVPIGPSYTGPIFFGQYTFQGFNPVGLLDVKNDVDYFEQNQAQAQVHNQHAIINPNGFIGYGENCWGLTAGDGPDGYKARQPKEGDDDGTINPTGALSAFPWLPEMSMKALRHYYDDLGPDIWTDKCGFVDGFNQTQDWYDSGYLALDQAPIINMIENYRSQLLWNLFMSCTEIQQGLDLIGFVKK